MSHTPSPAEIVLGPFLTLMSAQEAVRKAYAEQDREANRGVRWSGLEPMPFKPRDEAQLRADAEAARASREAYLTSNLGRARKAIADGCQAAQQIHARLNDVGAALSRGDGTHVRKAEDCAETLMRLRLLVSDVEAYCRLVKAEGES
jgi:hypothetical protein